MDSLQEYSLIFSIIFVCLAVKRSFMQKTEVVCKKDSILGGKIKNFKTIREGHYKSSIWCINSVLNTFLLSIQRRVKLNYQREILSLPDRGQLALDWENREHARNKKVVLILPGLTSTSQSSYVTHYVNEAKKHGCVVVVMNYRGISLKLLTPRLHCGTDDEDLEFVLDHIQNLYPQHTIIAIACSVGGILLGNYLGRKSKRSRISSAFVVSTSFNLRQTLDESEKLHFYLLNKNLGLGYKQLFSSNKEIIRTDKRIDVDRLLKSRTLRELLLNYNVKFYGFETAEAFYDAGSIESQIELIKIPCVFLNSSDDLFSPARAFPIDKIISNPNTVLIKTAQGGHLSFAEGYLPIGCNYACRLISDYLDSILKELE